MYTYLNWSSEMVDVLSSSGLPSKLVVSPGQAILAFPNPSRWPLCKLLFLNRFFALPLLLPWGLTEVMVFHNTSAGPEQYKMFDIIEIYLIY